MISMAEQNDEIVQRFAEVLKLSESRTIDIIRHLDQNVPTSDYFIRCLQELKPLSKSESGAIRIAHSNNNIVENMIKDKPIGKGAYGEVSLSVKGRIYKKIRIQATNSIHIELALREIFLETFIQTVLSYNEKIRNNIPRIFHLYRSDKTPKIEGVLYVVMEHVPHTLNTVLKQILKDKRITQLSLEHVASILIQISSLLTYLYHKYDFYHGDLHGGNIMFGDDYKSVKLIDFGKSCLTINGVTYSLVYENIGSKLRVRDAPCKSWDLLILLTYLLDYNSYMFDNDLIYIFHNIMTSLGGVDLYEGLKPFAEQKRMPLFHAMYPDNIAQWPMDLRKQLVDNTPLLESMKFTVFIIDLHRNIMSKKTRTSNVYSRKVFEPTTVRSGGKIASLHRMAKKCNRKNTRKNSRCNRKSGGGYQTSQQMFDPDVLPPSTILAAPSTAPTSTEIRPVLYSSFQSGAGRTRRNRKNGGFSPSVMGGFVANAQAAIVPLALYAVYHTMVPKTGNTTLGGLFNSKNTRKNTRSRK